MIKYLGALCLVAVAMFVTASHGASPDDLDFVVASSLPSAVRASLASDRQLRGYELSSRINPFYLQADFNGDGRVDTSILVRSSRTKKMGIAVIHGGSEPSVVLGADRHFGNGSDDFSWMNAWHVYPRGPVPPGPDEAGPPRLIGDGLMVLKTESASAIIYWTGTGYAWYQQGD